MKQIIEQQRQTNNKITRHEQNNATTHGQRTETQQTTTKQITKNNKNN